MSEEWLRLSEVAGLLGVHPSTVRNWANQGRLPVQRTGGGHRRFRRSELELWKEARLAAGPEEAQWLIQRALSQARIQIGEGALDAESWYQKLDAPARAQYRRSGRELLQSLLAYIRSDEGSAEGTARATGEQYASAGRRHGLTGVEAASAFLFFRHSLFESLIAAFEAAAIGSPVVWSDMLRKISAFTDQVLLALLESYQRMGESR